MEIVWRCVIIIKQGGIKMADERSSERNHHRSSKMWKLFSIIGSGLLGSILAVVFNNPHSITIIENGEKTVVTESSYLELVEENQNLQQQLEERKSAQNISKIIQQATTYWNNSDSIQALTILKNSDLDSAEITTLYEKYSSEYSNSVLAQVDNLISNRKYADAQEILIAAKEVVNNPALLESKLLDIQNNAPMKLSNLKISASRFFESNQEQPLEDTIGNKYSTGNLFIISAEGDTKYGYATFYLGKQYTDLTGSISVSDESENRSDVQLEGWVEIYSKNGDDYTQLYQSPILSRVTSVIEIPTINVNDVEWLEIRYYNNGDYYSLARGYHSLEIILSNFMLYSI